MSNEPLIVVGDRFKEFLANGGTVPVSEMIRRLDAGVGTAGADGTDGGDAGIPAALVAGQGLSSSQLARLHQGCAGREEPVPVTAPTPVERELTHKRDGRNVMIGMPQPVGPDRFVADLVIDERNEVLEDHLTGQHIPAVALIEAARQLWTVVTEKYFLPGTAATRFVVVSVDSRFDRYVFPLPTTLHFEVLEREKGPVGEVFRCRTRIHQNYAVAATVASEYRVVPAKLSAKQESLAARQAVRTIREAATVPEREPAVAGGDDR